ncbi:MAG: dehypoxanthine futalosine cyclase [Candidatus Dadabacteria bacterium]|nr:dehypoxanthine futalosine cyclase [Candidatus Dadabacteria bacterium]
MTDDICQKAADGGRITSQDALALLSRAPLAQLGALASLCRQRNNPGKTVTFVRDTNPNYTNVCDTECLFCAFWRPPSASDAYTLTADKLIEMMRTSMHNGATTVLLQGGHNPDIGLDYYTEVVERATREIPGIHLHAFSAPEVAAIAKYEGISSSEVLQKLWDAGLRTIPGGGAEILSNRVRKKISPLKIDADRWIEITREAHEIGFKTTATMMFGHVEEDEDIVEHLERIRNLQDETGGFLAFIPWIFKPSNTFLERKVPSEAGGERYLRVLAVCRIFLDNFKFIQGSWFTQGFKIGSASMRFGADDLGGTLYEENVLRCAENRTKASADEIAGMIRSAGFEPAQRNTFYEIIRRF